MTKIINLDTLKREPILRIVVDGKQHDMVQATVETFIENMKAIEDLGLNASPVKEIEVIIGIVARAFPTLSVDEIKKWPLETIRQLSDIARGVSGEVATDDAEKAKEAAKTGNDQTAS